MDRLVERLRERGEQLDRTVAFGGLGYAGANDADLYTQAAARIEHLEARIEAAEKVIEPLLAIIDEGVSVNISDAELRSAHPEDRRFIKRTRTALRAAAQWQAGREEVG